MQIWDNKIPAVEVAVHLVEELLHLFPGHHCQHQLQGKTPQESGIVWDCLELSGIVWNCLIIIENISC